MTERVGSQSTKIAARLWSAATILLLVAVMTTAYTRPARAVGWCRDPNGCPGVNVPRGADTNPKPKPKPCKSASSVSATVARQCRAYAGTDDPERKQQIRDQIANEREDWEQNRGRCGYPQFPSCGADAGGSGSNAPSSPKSGGTHSASNPSGGSQPPASNSSTGELQGLGSTLHQINKKAGVKESGSQ